MTGHAYDVPADAPAHDCPYCDAVLPSDALRDLHVGHEHPEDAADDELDAFEDAYRTESSDLFVYHLKVIFLVVVVYFGFLFTYSAIP